MGRPTLQQRLRGISRRGFLKRAGAASVTLGVPLWPAARAAAAPENAAGTFAHGVASGDPLADAVVLWTHVNLDGNPTSVAVSYVVAVDPELSTIVSSGSVMTGPELDYTVKVDVTGLRSNTTYYYRFSVDGTNSAIGRTRTLPVGKVDHLRLGVVSCSNYAYGYFNAYARVAERADLDLVVHLGDYIYEYGDGEYGAVRPCEPPGETQSLADYRARHAQYKTDPDLQELHRQHPMIAIWDDHEVADNGWKSGATNHTEGSEGDWDERVASGLQAYYEWLPIRDQNRGDRRKAWRQFKLGDLAELFIVETRLTARAQQLETTGTVPGPRGMLPTFTQTGAYRDPRREMLGQEQEDWLMQGLSSSEARWKLIGQQVMFAPLCAVGLPEDEYKGSQYVNPDAWDGYNPARERFFKELQTRRLDNIVILTGDIHSSWAADLSPDPFNRDVSAGGYDPASGAGSRAVEFVTTSVTSPGLDDYPRLDGPLKTLNPHFKYAEMKSRGYLLLDVTAQRVSAEWWFVDTVNVPSATQRMDASWKVPFKANHLQPSMMSAAKAAPPAAP